MHPLLPDLGPLYLEGDCPGWPGYLANWATWGGLISHMFLSKTHQSVYMLDRVARLSGAPCLLARGPPARWGSFLPCQWFEPGYLGQPRWDKPCKHGGMKWIFSKLPSASVICQTEWQSIWRDQCNRQVSGWEQARAPLGSWNKMEKSVLGRPLRLLCLAAAQEITHAVHSLSRLGDLHVKAGYVSTLLAGKPG